MTDYPKVPGYGPAHSPLLIIAEAPGRNEEKQGRPLVGISGSDTDSYLRFAGWTLDQCYRTNVFKFRPPGNNIRLTHVTGHTIEEGLDELYEEINSVEKNAILAMGNLSLKTLTGKTGIKKYRGSILWSDKANCKVIPTIHPAALYHQEDGRGALPYSYRALLAADFKRAVEESKTKEYEIPERDIQIARSSLDLHRFLNVNSNRKRATLDIESFNGIPVCVGIAFDSQHGLVIPLHNVANPSYVIPENELNDLWYILAQFLEDPTIELIGQNIKYDHQKLLEIGFRVRCRIHFDTMLAFHTLYPELPAKLEVITSLLTREPYYKDEGKEFDPSKHRFDRVLYYCGKDITVEYEAYEQLEADLVKAGCYEFFNSFVMPLHALYMDIESVGFQTDEDERERVFEKYHEWNDRATDELYGLIGRKINLNSSRQVSTLLYGRDNGNLRLPIRKSTDEDTIVSLLGNVVKDERKRKILEGILAVRRIRKAITTSILCIPDYDGRLRTVERIDGTETGRTSNTKQKPPIRQKMKIGKKKYDLGLGFQTITKHGDYGTEVGGFLIPDRGHCFLKPDLSQAEARIVALLAKDEELLELFHKGFDVHRLTSWWCYRNSDISVKDALEKTEEISKLISQIGKDERFVGKTGRHMCNYDAQKKRLMLEVNTNAKKFHIPVSISEWRAGQIIDIFHTNSPKVRGIFHEDVRKALSDFKKTLINPFGRPRLFMGRWDDDLFKEAYAQIPQSTVGDHLKGALLRIKKRIPYLKINVESHDAANMMPEISNVNEVAAIAKEEFEKPIDFEKCSVSRGELVIPCEIEVSFENYRDWEKMKI